jgi:hypothetical protein
MKDRSIAFWRWVLKVLVWRGRTLGRENLPQHGPALFLGNHSGTLGPIACVAAVDLRLYPWIVADMIDPQLCPAYLQMDFVEKDLKLKPPLSGWVARRLARMVVPLLTGFGCVPVQRGVDFRQARATLEISLDLLLRGECLLVFPEKPAWEADPITGIHRFSKGVLWLVELFYIHTGRPLRVIPFTVHPTRKICFLPGVDLTLNDFDVEDGKELWIRSLEGEIRSTYRELETAGRDI